MIHRLSEDQKEDKLIYQDEQNPDVVAKSLGIEQAFKPNITRYTNMLFERDAFKRSVEYKYEGENPSTPSD